MSDFLNKTWTIESEECLDEEMLDDCCPSTMHIQLQQQPTVISLSTTFLVDDDKLNTTTTVCNETINVVNTSLSRCSFEIENFFNRFNYSDLFLLEDEPIGFEFEDGEPICSELKTKCTINNQTINIEDDKPLKDNLNITMDLKDSNKTVIKSPQRAENQAKLNVTIDIDDDEPVKESLNVTIEIKDKNSIDFTSTDNIIQLNTFAAIPNSFDLFADDLNKQSILNSPPSSSASSSTSSLTSKLFNNNANSRISSGYGCVSNLKTQNKILTSSIDKDLNKISHVSKQTEIVNTKNEEIKSKKLSMSGKPPHQSAVVKSGIPGLKSTNTPTQVFRNSTNNNPINNTAVNANKNSGTVIRKKSIKKPGITSPSSHVNNLTIDIGDENKIKSDVLFNDIECSNIIQPMSNTFAPIPNSFDLFANDLNKQSLNSPPSSSASSSTSSLTSKYNNNRGVLPASSKLSNYKTSVKILTSSIDKDLNKITFSNPNDVVIKQEEIKPKSNIPAPRQSMIPSLKTSSGIPIPSFKSSIPTFKSNGQVLRNSTNNNIAVKK